MTKIEPGRHILFASTGGHLAQLVKWSSTIGSADDSLWVTFDSPQSRSLVGHRNHLYVPYIPPRGIHQAVKSLPVLIRDINWRDGGFNAAVSTGAALALPALTLSRVRGIPSYYIESVSRVEGPSLSGKILSWLPGIDMSCQHANWARGKWSYRGTVLEQYERMPKPKIERPRLFVTLGTIKPYRFDSLVDAILDSGLADDRTVWQLGCTERTDLPGEVHAQMRGPEFDAAASNADLIITHAGVGTILKFLDMGIYPVVVPRRRARGEHVDDHQLQIASVVSDQMTGAVMFPEEITASALLDATGYVIRDDRYSLPASNL
ncbi:glycosyl transferase [Rhodococcus pyridinivorans]|uniref:glycosyltransferase n=1 Tax=Rhodococcus pyridinivorans TaxID=103816 RepID=UPI0022279F92|nr:glycosyltransferase [Rhodococcus pyridinivorans]MCW3468057.1 glycosyl transferase [Rhodococcus pyridinivorans]